MTGQFRVDENICTFSVVVFSGQLASSVFHPLIHVMCNKLLNNTAGFQTEL